ncbi:MAG: dienelactone hydrolase family protein [Anaerolineae bacterium]
MKPAVRALIAGCLALTVAACTPEPAPIAEWEATIVPPDADRQPGQDVYTFTREVEQNGEVITQERDYLLYVPEAYFETYESPWPLVIFLHGTGEKGTNPRLLVTVPPFVTITREEGTYPFIMAAPHLGFAEDWVTSPDLVFDMIVHLRGQLSIDPDRIVIAGFSLGGQGVWAVATAYPDLPAALVPVSGFWSEDDSFVPPDICQHADLPVWIMHSRADEIVPLAGSEVIANALQDCGTNVRFTIYDDLTHAETALAAFTEPALIDCILAQSRQ